jgi:hypothetical protein
VPALVSSEGTARTSGSNREGTRIRAFDPPSPPPDRFAPSEPSS